MATVEALANLQDIEEALQKNKLRQREVERLLAEPEALQMARRVAAQAEENMHRLRTEQRNLEAESQAVTQQSKANQQRLYSGGVTNPRELKDLQDKINSLGKRQKQLEDLILDSMLQVEQANKDYAEASTTLVKITEDYTKSSAQYSEEQEGLLKQAAALQERIKQARSQVNAEALARYDTLKTRKGNRAVARLRGDSCLACGVQVPTHVVQRAKQGLDLVPCPSCGRFLCSS